MKNLDSIVLEIKQIIRARIINCPCRYNGIQKKVAGFKTYSQNGFNFVEKFDLAEVPVTGSINVSVRFNALLLIDIDGNVKTQSYVNGTFGPIEISFSNSEYNIDTNTATISGLSN